MERGTRFFEVALAMYDKRKAICIDTHDGVEKASEIVALYSDDTVTLGELVNSDVSMMDIIRFGETTKPVRG